MRDGVPVVPGPGQSVAPRKEQRGRWHPGPCLPWNLQATWRPGEVGPVTLLPLSTRPACPRSHPGTPEPFTPEPKAQVPKGTGGGTQAERAKREDGSLGLPHTRGALRPHNPEPKPLPSARYPHPTHKGDSTPLKIPEPEFWRAATIPAHSQVGVALRPSE